MSRRYRLVATLLLLCAGRLAAQTLYWEQPSVLVAQGEESSVSIAGSSVLLLAWQEIRPRSVTDHTSGDIFLSLATSHDGASWTTRNRFFGP
ncbi:MAG TPA: hypothetical protein VHE79_05365, partial [Spirochaetia bacterium]